MINMNTVTCDIKESFDGKFYSNMPLLLQVVILL